MRIALDARWIFPEISGIGSYTREIIRQLAIIDRNNEYVLIFDKKELFERTARETGLSAAPNFSPGLVPWGVFDIGNQLFLPGWLRRNRIEVYHSTNYMIPFLAFPRNRPGRIKCVTSIHDAIPLMFPAQVPKSKKARLLKVFKFVMQEVGRRADIIITGSDASRRDLVQHLGIPSTRAAKVRRIYDGIAERFKPAADRTFDKAKDAVRTILYVGRADPYKNLVTLISAMAEVRKRSRIPAVLKIAGSPDARYPEAQELAAQLNLGSTVQWTGYLSDDELLKLYQTADLLVHPSRYEGFGLQVAEAMACGTPVICSNGGSLPEVAGTAAITLQPLDVEGFAVNICKVLASPAISEEMSGKGITQSRQFTWRKCAKETLAVYESAAGMG